MQSVKRRPGEDGYELVAFDVRFPDALCRLISEGAAWKGRAHVELLDAHHAILIVRPGGASVGFERRAA